MTAILIVGISPSETDPPKWTIIARLLSTHVVHLKCILYPEPIVRVIIMIIYNNYVARDIVYSHNNYWSNACKSRDIE